MIGRQFKYYDLKKKWPKVKRHLNDKTLNDILVMDFNKYTFGRWGDKFTSGQYPTDFESCDWQLSHRGRRPAYWKYTKHAACHWLVNFTLRLAMLVEPDQEWRIITSQRHSTVWNGDDMLFDFNFQALGIAPNECFQSATLKRRELKPGKYFRVYFAAHYTQEEYSDPALSEYERKAKRLARERGKISKSIDDIKSQMYQEAYDAWNCGKKRETCQPFLRLGDAVRAQLFGTVGAALEGVTEQGV
jgi:hypothetical protein